MCDYLRGGCGCGCGCVSQVAATYVCTYTDPPVFNAVYECHMSEHTWSTYSFGFP